MGGGFLVVGLLLLIAAGAYYGYGALANSRVDELAYSSQRPVATPALAVRQAAQQSPPGGRFSPSQQDSGERAEAPARPLAGVTTPKSGAQDVEFPKSEQQVSSGATTDNAPTLARTAETGAAEERSQAESTGSGGQVDASGGRVATVDASGPLRTPGEALTPPTTLSRTASGVQVFTGIVDDAQPLALTKPLREMLRFQGSVVRPEPPEKAEAAGPATRISIPGIDVESSVQDLSVVVDGDVRQFETPKHTVGHIPSTAYPAQQGEGWYFGHLESILAGEGNVFQRLPEIPRMLQRGEAVQVLMESNDREYVYQVYRTQVVRRDELRITNSGKQDITLVTCWPRFHYNQRLLVTAALVEVRDA